ncbi:C40 family peptidase [Actinospica durhamensis]|uniref:C40 family peptidase n=1 Tax=Actinospica durhamensis TaxID=1508375 RepID=A0A941F1H9_9ACTN|nr:C40 family peptidase [Actinospica durhamensis]MBR7839299.1 C40 family peptidase [Actinospica durhamensis]
MPSSHRAPKLATRRVGSAAAIVGVAAGSVFLMQGSAHAETTAQALADYKQKTAEAEAATEQYDSSSAQVAQLQQKINALQGQISAANQKMVSLESAMGRQAAQQYRESGLSDSLKAVLDDSPDSYLNAALASNQVTTQEAQQLKELAEAKTQIAEDNKLAQSALAQQQQVTTQRQAAKTKALQSAAQAKSLYGSLNASQQAAIEKANAGVSASSVTITQAAPDARAAAAVAYAKSKLGDEYVYAAAGPSTFDCSGLTMMAWEQAGVSLPHNAAEQYATTTHISASQLEPGDLVYYDYGEGITHVAIYVGNGMVIHAPHTGTVVQYGELYNVGPVAGFSRP